VVPKLQNPWCVPKTKNPWQMPKPLDPWHMQNLKTHGTHQNPWSMAKPKTPHCGETLVCWTKMDIVNNY